MVIRICSSTHNFYMLGVRRNSALLDNIFNCLLTLLIRYGQLIEKSFLFDSGVSAYHEEWLSF